MNTADRVTWLLENYGQNDQRTSACHAKRGQMLTASEIYKGLSTASPAQRYDLIMSKLQPKPVSTGPGSKALLWGTRFEPIAKQIYCELQHKIEIADTTCIPHPNVSFLGASPDGIIISNDNRHGKLVEFKCPISRQFTDQTPIPNEYFHQMQLQMECTGLEECEYIEMQFKDLSYTEWMNSQAPYKSFFAVLEEDNKVMYKDFNDNRTVAEWRSKELGEDHLSWKITYWALNNWRSVTVPHQKDWLSQHLPSLTAVWKEVEEYRKTGSFPPPWKQEKETLVL